MNLSLRVERAADRQSRMGLSGGSGTEVARAFSVDPSTRSHWASGKDKGPLYRICKATLTCKDEDGARAILTAVQQAYERRPLLNAATPLLLNRCGVLFDREFILTAEAAREKLLFVGGGPVGSYYEAVGALVAVQSELMELVDELTGRGVDVRDVLCADPPRRRK